MAGGIHVFEDLIGGAVINVVGDPSIAGLLILGFFLGFVLVANVRGDLKTFGIMGGAILASLFLPVLAFLALLTFAALLLFAIMKFQNR